MKKIFLTIAIIISVFYAQAQNGTIKGRVFNEKSNEPLPFTNIIVFGTTIGSTSDLDGNFIFTGIAPGFVKLAATSVGFEQYISEEFQVTNAKTTFVNIPMRETSIQLDQVVVKASPFRKTEESPVSMRTLGIGDIEKNPGANRDISKVLQALPGVASTVSFRNDIIVRGGGPSENRFYLDGMEIPNLNHFATQGASGGPVGIINVDFIREIDFYSGAFPANRGNAISSILEMKQIDGNPERLIVKAAFGASDLALTLNGPLSDNTTFLFSARRSYLQFLFGLIGLPFLPTYNDFQFKVKTKFDQKHELTLLGIGAIDQFRLNTGIKNPDEDQRYILNYLPVNEQWNYALGAVYKHYRTSSFDTWVFSRNMLNNVAYKYVNNDENLAKTLDYTSQEIENKVRYENSSRINEYKIIAGAGGEYAKYNTSTFQKVFIPQAQDTIRSIDYGSAFDMFKYHMFAQVSRNFMNDRLILSAGLRAEGNNYSENMSNPLNQLSPRFSSALAITDKIFFNFNTGRYYQQPAYTTLGFRDNSGRLLNKDNNLKYIASNHIVAGMEYRRTEAAKLTLEGFFKFYDNYPVSVTDSISLANKGGDFGIFGNEEVTSNGKGRAYGFEVYLRDKIMDQIDVIFSYTFVRSEFKDNKDIFIPSAWDNRHLINLTLGHEFKHNWNVGAKWRFVGGSPYTPWDLNRSSLKDAWDARQQGYLDSFGDNNGYGLPARYHLKEVVNQSGTVLPTIGIIVEF